MDVLKKCWIIYPSKKTISTEKFNWKVSDNYNKEIAVCLWKYTFKKKTMAEDIFEYAIMPWL